MMKKIRVDNRGFSIIEAMVAIVILSIIFIPITNSFISSIKASQETKIMQAATTTAQQVMEDFKNDTIVNLANNYDVLDGANVFDSSWAKLRMEKKISRADNHCCDFTVEVQLSKSSTDKNKLTEGLAEVNSVDFGIFTTLDSASNLILNVGHIPYWIAKTILKEDFPALDPMVSDEVREEQIRNALLSKKVTRKIIIEIKEVPSMGVVLVCKAEYYKAGTLVNVDCIEDTVLSSEAKNLYVYFPKFEDGKNKIAFNNQLKNAKLDDVKLNFYLIQDEKNGELEVERVSDLDSLKNISMASNLKIGGAVSVVETNDFVKAEEKRSRRYEVIVNVYKGTERKKPYLKMVSTRGE